MQLTGEIIFASKIEQVTDTFKKRDLVIRTNDNPSYPQEIKIELHQDNVELITGMKKGDTVTVDINIRGRGWVNKDGKKQWFNTIAGWRVTKASGNPEQEPAPKPAPVPTDDEDDDLPFN